MEGFLSLLIYNRERFVRPIDCWDDTFEGYMLHLLDSDDGLLQVIERLYSDISDQIVDITIRNFSKLQRSRYACYGLCWSKVKDSDALWRIYSYGNKSIQLISSKSQIIEMLNAAGWLDASFDIYSVQYDIEDEKSAINKILKRNSKIVSAYFHKRPAFKHEEEVRVLINDSERYKKIDAFSIQAIKANYKLTDHNKNATTRLHEAIKNLNVKENYRKIVPKELFVDINNLSSYIEGVRVHPQATEWYADLINTLCQQYGLKYKGKSDLYRKA